MALRAKKQENMISSEAGNVRIQRVFWVAHGRAACLLERVLAVGSCRGLNSPVFQQ